MWFAERAQLQIGLLNDRIVLLPANRRTQSADVLAVTPAAATGEPPWQSVLRCLADWLSRNDSGQTKVQVCLGSCFVRWQLLEWSLGLQGEQELNAYAQLQMRAAFGQVAMAWRTKHGQASPGEAVPVCAVDEGLTEALGALQSDRGLRVTSAAPYFSRAFDHWRGRLPRRGSWFGVVEPHGLTLGLLSKGQWRGLRVQRLAEVTNWSEVLPPLKAQLALAAGLPEADNLPVFLAGCVPSPAHIGGVSWLEPATQHPTSPIDRLALGV